MSLHRQEFPPAQPPVVPSPPPVDEPAIRARHKQEALHGLGLFQRAARAQAKQAAQRSADQEIATRRAQLATEQQQWQQHLNQQWAALCANDSDIVLATLEEAFEDNEAPAAAVGVDGAEVALVVLVPGQEAIPERLPGVTEAGNLSLRKTPKKAQAAFYAQMVAGYVLVTIREAFAVAPSLASARAVAIRIPGLDAYGHPRVECLLATRITRTSLEGVRWDVTDAATVLNDTNSELLINQKGQAKEIQPLVLTAEPELAELLSRVDAEALAANRSQ